METLFFASNITGAGAKELNDIILRFKKFK